ncbi:STM3941 family protein [Alkalihalobacterium bogoriense]|uniref:STM3941 family protein n=1 Tax=Alkalihalobacterium bogoriense TaxID=246272 RepID=UPI00047A3D8E|nr:STM3941 family protein [Alkalihalobacterium bogoriense]
MQKKYYIYRSRGKLLAATLFLLLLVLLFSFVGVFLLFNRGVTVDTIANIVAVVFLFIFYSYVRKKYKENKPEVILNEEGLYLESFSILIRWEDIDGYYIQKVLKLPFLFFVVKNEEKYIEQLKRVNKNKALTNVDNELPAFDVYLGVLENKAELIKALEDYQVPMVNQISS